MELQRGFDVAAVDRNVAAMYGVAPGELWQDAIQPHAEGGYFAKHPGVVFGRRNGAVRASSAPQYVDAVRAANWRNPESGLGAELGLVPTGLGWTGVVTASKLQHRPRPGLVLVEGGDRSRVNAELAEWQEAGGLRDPGRPFTAMLHGEPVGVANLTPWGPAAENIDLLVSSEHRGRKLGNDIAAAAALIALQTAKFVVYRYAITNDASAAIGRRIGAQHYCDGWAFRPPLPDVSTGS